MTKFRQKFLSLLTAFLVFLPVAGFAQDLGAAKAQGLVGEMSTGYLGAVVNSPEANQVVQSINAQRRAQYQNIASNNGTSLSNVEVLAGQKAIERTPSGQYINTGGGWQRK